jgi:hypothetical protein
VLRASQARLFFFDFADLAVDLVARGFGKGIEEFLEAFGLAEFTGEDGMDWHGRENLTTDGKDGADFHGYRARITRLCLLPLRDISLIG